MKVIFAVVFLCFGIAGSGQDSARVSVYFATDKYLLNDDARKTLDSLLRELPTALPGKIRVSGFCDSRGAIAYNDALAERRSEAVAAYLEASSPLAHVRIERQSYGERRSLNENGDPLEMQRNRRVDIIFGSASITDQFRDSVRTGDSLTLQHINFYGGQHQFLPESFPMLTQLLDAMKAFPTLVIEVQGHICCQPDEREGLDIETGIYNLSAARAAAVRSYLIEHGIEPARVSSRGFGHSAPIFPYPEKSEAEQTANRRVVVKIIKK